MDSRFYAHNTHRESPDEFALLDPQLRRLARLPLVYNSPIVEEIPDVPGIYTVTGGRQVGKTTLLKQWMQALMRHGVPPEQISFFTGELIDDHHALLPLLETELAARPADHLFYVVVDEVTYIKNWDKAIKFAADAGLLDDTVLVVTGSDQLILKDARTRFPGRRGPSEDVDFHFHPLSFHDVVTLKKAATDLSSLFFEFEQYLLHGGYLLAVNTLESTATIDSATLRTYGDWIRGDVLKAGKQERYLREVVQAIVKRQGSQITWNALARDLSIDHPATVADYVGMLERMDAVFVQSAIREDALTAAPKKAKKISFADPFIRHALDFWLQPDKAYFSTQMSTIARNPALLSMLAEGVVANHFKRRHPTYYIKSKGEVDVAYVNDEAFWPVEVKWTGQLRPADLKQISRYSNGQIWSNAKHEARINNVVARPLPVALYELG